jgi:hypothetical protein
VIRLPRGCRVRVQSAGSEGQRLRGRWAGGVERTEGGEGGQGTRERDRTDADLGERALRGGSSVGETLRPHREPASLLS